MLKKTIKYKDYNGVEHVDDFYFNLSKAEIAEMEMNESQMAKDGQITGGLKEKFDSIRAGGKGSEILKAFKDILFMAYGEKSEDGKRFHKSADISRAFAETDAYSELFMELINDSAGAAKFMNGIMPAEFLEASDSDKPDPSRRPQAPQEPRVDIVVDAEPSDAAIEAYLAKKRKDPNGPENVTQ